MKSIIDSYTQYIAFLLALLQFVAANAQFRPTAMVQVSVPQNTCVVAMLPDGYTYACQENQDGAFEIDVLSGQFEHTAVCLFRPDGTLTTCQTYSVSDILKQHNIKDQSISTTPTILWPPKDAVITSSSLDVHFHFGSNYSDACVLVSNVDTAIGKYCSTESSLIPISYLEPGIYNLTLILSLQESSMGDDRSRIVMSIDSTEIRIEAVSTTQSSRNNLDKQPLLMHSNELDGFISGHGDFQDAMHVLVMSVRSLDRFQEAEVMLKSLLLHTNFDLFSPDSRQFLVIHMVVDSAARQYFSHLYRSSNFNKMRNVLFIFHDFESVCVESLNTFLSNIGMTQSPHHSGKAGYCRLFLHEYFSVSNSRLSVINTEVLSDHGIEYVRSSIECPGNISHGGICSLLYPTEIVAIESDQLFLSDVTALFEYFDRFDNEQMIAAAENYQPWVDSRPYSLEHKELCLKKIYYENYMQGNRDSLRGTFDNHYHGFGIVGGIMLLDLKKMQNIGFSKLSIETVVIFQNLIRRYCFSDSIAAKAAWQARQNDQDIFNAIMAIHVKWFAVLPCEWNVQYHARVNTMIHCLSDIPGYQEWKGERTNQGLSVLNDEFFRNRNLKFDSIPLNCENSRKNKVFVCDNRPKILHFMAQTYKDYDFTWYFPLFWRSYEMLPWGNVIGF